VDVTELVERVADLATGGFDEAGDVHISHSGAQQKGQINGGVRNLVTNEIEDQRTGRAFASHRDGDVGAARSFEQTGDGGGVHAFSGFTVNGDDFIAGADAGFIRWSSFEGIEDDDLNLAAGGWLGLNGHADAVVLAVLVLAHLGKSFGVVEVRMGIEDVKHAWNRAIVDSLVGLVRVEGFCVVLLDQGIDVGEGVEGVAQGGLITSGLGGNLLVDEGADDGAGCQKDGSGEECATSAGSHGLG